MAKYNFDYITGKTMEKYTKSIMIRVAPATYDKLRALTEIEDRTISNMARVLLNEALRYRGGENVNLKQKEEIT